MAEHRRITVTGVSCHPNSVASKGTLINALVNLEREIRGVMGKGIISDKDVLRLGENLGEMHMIFNKIEEQL